MALISLLCMFLGCFHRYYLLPESVCIIYFPGILPQNLVVLVEQPNLQNQGDHKIVYIRYQLLSESYSDLKVMRSLFD